MDGGFRFGVVGESIRSGADLTRTARRAESLGYDVLVLGTTSSPSRRRVGRLEESLTILRSLLGGRKTTFAGDHYRVDGLTAFPRPARRPRIVVGAGSRRMLGIAARHADTVGILPRALPEGRRSSGSGSRTPSPARPTWSARPRETGTSS